MKLPKPNKLDICVILVLLALNLFWLPTMGVWNIYPKTKYISQNGVLAQFQHPPVPIVRLIEKPNMSAGSYILIDNKTNKVLVSKNSSNRIYPASTTKLATALTALNIYPLDEVITVPQAYTEGQVMNLQPGEKITVKSLVTALLVYSANDSAYNLAIHHTDSIDGFVKQMNSLIQKYGLKDTHFVNPDGLHNNNHYTTAYDLAELGRIAIKNPTIREVVKNKSVVVSDIDNKIQHHLQSTDELLGVVPEVEGLKTGWTPEAEGVFIGLLNINGHELLSVVAQSQDRFQDTRTLIDWAKKNVTWQN
jgi:D-alanyl-D-alanine carboxypeptidase (penicillin-binding protein 5/6)